MRAALFLLLTLFTPTELRPISIDGIVVRSDTGEPVAGAIVMLADATGRSIKSESRADISGRFVFADVEPGRYQLTAGAEGFSAGVFGSNSLYAAPTILAIDSDTSIRSLGILLIPMAAISGKVFLDETRLPVSG